MLPKPLKDAIYETYRARQFRTYATHVGEADKIWQAEGIWKPPVPMSQRATKGVDALRAALDTPQ